MAENLGLADQAVQALAMVKAMDDGLETGHPEQHAIRSMQRVAQQVISDGLRSAIDLAWQANGLRKLAREIEAAKTPNVELTGLRRPYGEGPVERHVGRQNGGTE